MSDIPEALGDLAQATLIARAIEPVAGEGANSDPGRTHSIAALGWSAATATPAASPRTSIAR